MVHQLNGGVSLIRIMQKTAEQKVLAFFTQSFRDGGSGSLTNFEHDHKVIVTIRPRRLQLEAKGQICCLTFYVNCMPRFVNSVSLIMSSKLQVGKATVFTDQITSTQQTRIVSKHYKIAFSYKQINLKKVRPTFFNSSLTK